MTTIADTIKKAMSTHWVDTPYAHGPVEAMAWHLCKHFEIAQGVIGINNASLSAIEESDIEDFKAFKRSQGVSNATINKYLSCLSILFDVAGVPKPTIKRLPEKRVEKWWMQPDQLEDLLKYLRSTGGVQKARLANLIELMAKGGLRVQEALSLLPRHIVGDYECLKVPGTKTNGAEALIPIFEACKPVLQAMLADAYDRGPFLAGLTYLEAQTLWQIERKRLGLGQVPTATLKAFRRTFAAYATQAGMPTATLQKVMRHESITTTQGYLRLTGDPALEEARKYMQAKKIIEDDLGERKARMDREFARVLSIETHEGGPTTLKVTHMGQMRECIKAYTETGATPEEVAEFTMALLKG